jgi:hypothetical protein
MLKFMLEQERVRGGTVSGEMSTRLVGTPRLPSPTRSHQQQQQDSFFPDSRPSGSGEYRRDSTPRRPATAASSPSRGKTLRWKETSSTSASHQPHQQSLSYTQFVPTDTKRGKWWLRDRQILTRNVPAPNDHTVAMKVRETWQWSGRTVVVDKIVTGPRPRDDEYEDSADSEREYSDHTVRDLQGEAAQYREELRRMGNGRSPTTSPTTPLSSTTAAAQAAFHDSKQLAKEFIQPPKTDSTAALEEISGEMRTASQRMEAQMAHALAASSEGQPAVDVHTVTDESTPALGGGEPPGTVLPQLSPNRSSGETSLPALQ